MGERRDVALRRAIVAVLVVLNISVVCFYVLWEVADTIAVTRAEEHGFDPQHCCLTICCSGSPRRLRCSASWPLMFLRLSRGADGGVGRSRRPPSTIRLSR